VPWGSTATSVLGDGNGGLDTDYPGLGCRR